MDQQVVSQKMESLRRCLDRIYTKCPATVAALASDLDAQDIVTLNLTRAIQLAVDIASHIIAEHSQLSAPATMGQSFDRMAEAGLIGADLALSLRRAVGFRNLAVHNYEAVDWAIVHAICTQKLGDFKAMAVVVDELLDRQRH